MFKDISTAPAVLSLHTRELSLLELEYNPMVGAGTVFVEHTHAAAGAQRH